MTTKIGVSLVLPAPPPPPPLPQGKRESEQPRREVVARDMLGRGWYVEIIVPQHASVGAFDDGTLRIDYLHWTARVPLVEGLPDEDADAPSPGDGYINQFVHHAEPVSLRGQRIIAEVIVYEKRMDDGATYLYVDHIPAPGKTPTHTLTVYSYLSEASDASDDVFESSGPLGGGILVTPLS